SSPHPFNNTLKRSSGLKILRSAITDPYIEPHSGVLQVAVYRSTFLHLTANGSAS
ncbi:hypothetical protein GWI33_002733, partial [Rhynchophorus ferrugineus]